jgi:ribosomal protein L11 methyltransferase
MAKKPHWLELSVTVPGEFVEPAAELFRHYGKGGVVIEEAGGWNPDEGETAPVGADATVRTYMPVTPAYRTNRELIHIGLRLIAKIRPIGELQERELEEDEWEAAWKSHFSIHKVGKRLVLCPEWQEYEAKEGEIIVRIDPGMAFGTGHHPTTRRCLEAVDELTAPGYKVIDVGAGSGILSIAAAKLGAERIWAVEIDKVAVKACRGNFRANEVAGKARCNIGTVPQPSIPTGEADLVLANINSVALTKLAPDLRTLMKPGGWLVAAGILTEREADVQEAFSTAGLRVEERTLDDDWVSLRCKA